MPSYDAISGLLNRKRGYLFQRTHLNKSPFGTVRKGCGTSGSPRKSRGVSQSEQNNTLVKASRPGRRGNTKCMRCRESKRRKRCVCVYEAQAPHGPCIPRINDEIPKLKRLEGLGNLETQDLSVLRIPESLHAEIKRPNSSRHLSSIIPDPQYKDFKDLVKDLLPDDPISAEAARILSKCFPLHDRATIDKVVREAIVSLRTDNSPAPGFTDTLSSVEDDNNGREIPLKGAKDVKNIGSSKKSELGSKEKISNERKSYFHSFKGKTNDGDGVQGIEHSKGLCTDNHINRGACIQSTTYSTIGRYNVGGLQTSLTKNCQNVPPTRSLRNTGNASVPSSDSANVSVYDDYGESHSSSLDA